MISVLYKNETCLLLKKFNYLNNDWRTMNIYSYSKTAALSLLFLSVGLPAHAQIYSEQTLPGSNGSQNSIVVKSVDIDNDGDQDLVLGNEFQQNSILFNLGTGDFVTGNTGFTAIMNDTEDIGLGDFDSDGDVDIIFINQGGFGHEYYNNDGNGNFSVAGFLPATNGGSIAVGDVNNDNFPDVILGNLKTLVQVLPCAFVTANSKVGTEVDLWDRLIERFACVERANPVIPSPVELI